MYLIQKAIKEHVDSLLDFQSFIPNLKLVMERDGESAATSISYEYNELAEDLDNVQNGLLTIVLATPKNKLNIEHYKLVQYLKTKMDKISFNSTDDEDNEIRCRALFNSLSRTADRPDILMTSITFDVRNFITI